MSNLELESNEMSFNQLGELLARARKEYSQAEPQLENILAQFKHFLKSTPEPPQEWKDRLGDKAHLYDYHQIAFPDQFENPALDDEGLCQELAEEYAGIKFQALEHQLLSRNKFLFTDGHLSGINCPSPILMLESDPDTEDIPWDCCCYIFADESYYIYNLEEDEEEELGQDAPRIIAHYQEILGRMRLIPPIEGQDYGILK